MAGHRAHRARDGLADVFPRAGELAEIRAKRDRLSSELAAGSAEKAPGDPAHVHDTVATAHGSPVDTSATQPGRPGQGGRPAITPPTPPPHPDEGPRPLGTPGWSR